MAQRLLLTGTPPRMIISKPGFDADPSLDEDCKTFDSNWFGGNGIKWVLRKQQTFTPQGFYPPWDLHTMTIDFPFELNYKPACIAFHCKTEPKAGSEQMTIIEHTKIWCDTKSVTVQAPFCGADTSLVTLYVVVFESRPTQPRTEKTARIVIGANPYDNRKGLWITEPGCRAGDLREPHIISTDNDYLKLHATGVVQPTENGSAHNKFWTADFSFPPLPYYPIVFFSLAANDVNKRIFFPFDNSNKTNEVPSYWIGISKDKVHLSTRPRDRVEKFDFRVMVFRNKLRDA